MGNQNSNDSREFCIRIDLDNTTYYAGEEVSGLINLFIYKPFTPSTLFLKFSGKEVSKYSDTPTNSKACNQNKYEETKILIRNLTFEVCSWDTLLNQGNHSMPFRFYLPLDIPGTFKFKNSEEISIFYVLKAYICLNKTQVYAKLPIIIRQEFVDISKKIAELPLNKFLGPGKNYESKCELRIIFNKEPYYCNKLAQIFVEIDNKESLVTIKELEVSLYYIIECDKGQIKSNISGRIISKCEKVEVLPGNFRVGDNAVKVILNLPKVKKVINKMPSVHGTTFKSFFYVVAQVKSGRIFNCYYKAPQVMAFMQILPEVEIKNIIPIKPMYTFLFKYQSVDLRGSRLETNEEE